MKLSAEKLVAEELCHRRLVWMDKFQAFRISPIRALYIALDAGLRTEKDPEKAAENEFVALASRPGLDIEGANVYAIAMHHAKLAGILAFALRSTTTMPWKAIEDVPLGDHTWTSACYDMGDGQARRIALVDRWSDDRREGEVYGWRTMGEACALDKTILLTAVAIGSAQEKRRHSPWTRCYRHPRNHTFRLKRKTSEEDFSHTWQRIWREDAGISTVRWMEQMKTDGCMTELVHTVQVPVPAQRDAYREEMLRLAREMGSEAIPMRLAGCFGWSPCPFRGVCPDADPTKRGFVLRAP